MSTLFSPDSVFLQRFLRSGGYYKGDIDGLVGPKTVAALGEFETDTEQVASEIGSFDKRTEASIRTMLIPTQRAAREFMKNIAQAGLSQGFTVRILSGTRTFAEQGDLFEKHQHGGPLAARPGRSNHNFGIAWDVRVFNERGAYIDDLIDKKAMTKLIIISHLKVRIIRIAPNSHDAKSGASVC